MSSGNISVNTPNFGVVAHAERERDISDRRSVNWLEHAKRKATDSRRIRFEK